MIHTLLLMALGFLAGMMLAKFLDRTPKRPRLNPEGFISGLNEDMRRAIQREEIEAKIEAWHNSDYSGPLHEYLGMTEAEVDDILEQSEHPNVIRSPHGDDPGHPIEPA